MRRLCWLALLPLAALPLRAQEHHRPFGVGFILNRSTFLLPLELGHAITLEPEIGVYRYSQSSPTSTDSFSSPTVNARTWDVTAGVALLFALPERGNVRPYVGPRGGFTIYDYRSEPSGGTPITAKETDWWVGGAVGAQYFFSPHFSLGGEASVTYTYVGNTKYDPPYISSGNHYIIRRIVTDGDLIVRWFF